MRKIGWSFPIFDPPRRRLVSYRSAQKHLAPRAGACHHRHRIMTRLPPLSSMEAFLEVARHGTVKAAASELGLSMPALSRRIQTLEHAVGRPLFDRQHPGLKLNEAGRTPKNALATIIAPLRGGHRPSRSPPPVP